MMANYLREIKPTCKHKGLYNVTTDIKLADSLVLVIVILNPFLVASVLMVSKIKSLLHIFKGRKQVYCVYLEIKATCFRRIRTTINSNKLIYTTNSITKQKENLAQITIIWLVWGEQSLFFLLYFSKTSRAQILHIWITLSTPISITSTP